jgi:hypothetical protein
MISVFDVGVVSIAVVPVDELTVALTRLLDVSGVTFEKAFLLPEGEVGPCDESCEDA